LRLLLDTHALLWFLAGDRRLPRPIQAHIEDAAATVFVSAVSAYEVTLKHRLGKLPQAGVLALDFEGATARHGFTGLSVSLAHAQAAGSLEIAHRDPFDRLLIAQSLVENLTLVSNERVFDDAGVMRIW
jgi:PIN domain nuclease of toxin-antitoxin system